MNVYFIPVVAIIFVVVIYFLLKIEKINTWVSINRPRLDDTNTIISLLTMVGLAISVAAFYSQQQNLTQQQDQKIRVQAENDAIYLENSIKDIENDLDITSHILKNMPEWRSTQEFTYARYSTLNLEKVVANPTLNKDVRTKIINGIAAMNIANSQLDSLLSPNIDRAVTLDKLEGQASLIQSGLSDLKSQLNNMGIRFKLDTEKPLGPNSQI